MNYLLIIISIISFQSCSSIKQIEKMGENNKSKYIIYKDRYWNYPTNLESGPLGDIIEIHLEKEKLMLRKAGTLNFLANENMFKHKELAEYLEENLGESIEFKLNDEPFILADYGLRNPITNQNVIEILKISGFGVYKLIELNKDYDGKYIVLLSENYGFESESGNFKNFIYSNQDDANIGVTKYIFHQMTNLHTNFTRIKEDKSKTGEFKSFINGLEYFDFYEGYSVIQPNQEVIKKFKFLNVEELLKVKSEIDSILEYTNSDAYEINKI